jgi:hypothetical protein
VVRHIFQAPPVWIYTQSNITSIIFTWVHYTNTEKSWGIVQFMYFSGSKFQILRNVRRPVVDIQILSAFFTNYRKKPSTVFNIMKSTLHSFWSSFWSRVFWRVFCRIFGRGFCRPFTRDF